MPRLITNVEVWITRTVNTGFTDYAALREAARKDVANHQSAAVCLRCLHSPHPTHVCGALVPDPMRPLDSSMGCGCDYEVYR